MNALSKESINTIRYKVEQDIKNCKTCGGSGVIHGRCPNPECESNEIEGSGKFMGENRMGLPLAHRVSPVKVSLSLAVATMSPILACPAGI